MTTCASCMHFHEAEVDPTAIGQQRKGECRAVPPAVLVIPVRQPIPNFALGSAGVMDIVVQACYPLLPESFPACGMHKPGSHITLKPLLPLDYDRHSGEEGV